MRSSHAHGIKVSGLHWLSGLPLSPMPWAQRLWALPFMTVLRPSERFYERRGHRAQAVVKWPWQMLQLVVRWLPGREVGFVEDSRVQCLIETRAPDAG